MLAVQSTELWQLHCGDAHAPTTCTVKRDTTISKPANQQFPDGSYIGVEYAGTANHQPTIYWQDAARGFVTSQGTCGKCGYFIEPAYWNCGGTPGNDFAILVNPPPPSYPFNVNSAETVGIDAKFPITPSTSCTEYGQGDFGQPPPQ